MNMDPNLSKHHSMGYQKTFSDVDSYAGLTTEEFNKEHQTVNFFLNTSPNPKKNRDKLDFDGKRTNEDVYAGMNSKNMGRLQARNALGSIVYHDALDPRAGDDTTRQYFLTDRKSVPNVLNKNSSSYLQQVMQPDCVPQSMRVTNDDIKPSNKKMFSRKYNEGFSTLQSMKHLHGVAEEIEQATPPQSFRR